MEITCTMSASVSTCSCVHACGCKPPKAWQGMAHTQVPLTQRSSSQILSLQDQRGPLGSLCLTCWTHKMFMEIGLNQHFRKLFNLMLKTSGNCKSTVSSREGLTQRNWLLFHSSHFDLQPTDFCCAFDLKIQVAPPFHPFSDTLLESSGKVKGKWNTVSLCPFPFHLSFSQC